MATLSGAREDHDLIAGMYSISTDRMDKVGLIAHMVKVHFPQDQSIKYPVQGHPLEGIMSTEDICDRSSIIF